MCSFHLEKWYYSQIAPIVVQWLHISQPWVLSIDRTNWSFGSHTHSLVMLKKKKGNSNSDERMRTVTFLISAIILPTAVIVCLESAKVRII